MKSELRLKLDIYEENTSKRDERYFSTSLDHKNSY